MSYDSLISGYSPLQWLKLADAAGSGTAADSSGNGNNGTPNGVTFGVPGLIATSGDTAASFNGSSDITTSYNPTLSAITVIAWISNPSGGSAAAGRIAANDHTDYQGNAGFELLIANNGFGAQGVTAGSPMFYVGDGSSSGYAYGSSVIAAGTHMVAGTWDGATVEVYLDGASAGSQAFSAVYAPGSNGIALGYNPAYSGDYFTGVIAEYALFGSALTGSDIAALYAAGVGGGAPPLVIPSTRVCQAVNRAANW